MSTTGFIILNDFKFSEITNLNKKLHSDFNYKHINILNFILIIYSDFLIKNFI